MKNEFYKSINFNKSRSIFSFKSIGKNGEIKKVVLFDLLAEPDIYNLALADIDTNGKLDFESRISNNDIRKIFATIWIIITYYFEFYPERKIFINGSSPERTRLFRVVININLEELEENYNIYGILPNGVIINFIKNINFDGFIIEKKFKFDL